MIKIELNNFTISNDLPFVLIAGPCVIENENHSLFMAEKINKICFRMKGCSKKYKKNKKKHKKN